MAAAIQRGDLVVLDLGEGSGTFTGTVRAVAYQYLDGAEHTFVTVDLQHLKLITVLTLDELRAAERRAMFTPGFMQYQAFVSMVGARR